MARILTASDRKTLIRLASTLPKGSDERKAILAGLSKSAKTYTIMFTVPSNWDESDDDMLEDWVATDYNGELTWHPKARGGAAYGVTFPSQEDAENFWHNAGTKYGQRTLKRKYQIR